MAASDTVAADQYSGDEADLATPGPATDRTDDDVVSIDEAPNGLNGPYFQEIGRRKRQGRDAKVLVTADHAQTGVGKSNLCDFLGYVTDTTERGFSKAKTTIDPHEFIEMYSGKLPEGSAAIMEEAEQFDSRRANAHENVDASQKLQQARVREIIAYMNLPSPATIDGRFERLCDFWINVEIRGRARIYEKRIHRTKKRIYYRTMQTIEWPNMDGSATFEHMDRLKNDMLDDDTSDSTWVRESEVKERVDNAVKEARKEARREWIQALKNCNRIRSAKGGEPSGADIASLDVVDVTAGRVNQIARGE